jgi:Flp pilus assembly protein TadD
VAVNVARDASVRFPASGSLLRTLGVAYYRQGDLQSSQLVLQQALSLDKHDALAYFLLGCTHTKLGQSQQAQECYSQAERLDARLKVQK